MLRPGRGRSDGDRGRLDDDAGRDARAPGLLRGPLVLPPHAGNKHQAVWKDDYWDADPDWEWNSAAQDSPEELHTLWHSAVSRSRDLLSETMADGGLDQSARRSLLDGRTPSVRWIVVHMIEEYARHNGHADLIRESVDGLVGE